MFAPPPSLSSLVKREQAAVYILGQLYASYEVRLRSPSCGLCVEMPGFLYCLPSSADRTHDIHPSSRNQNVRVTSLGGIVYRGRFA